jgi:hypothetical protein
MTILARDLNSYEIQCVGLGDAQKVNFDASVQSTATSANTRIVRLVSATDCHIAIGADPTATTSSTFLPAYSVEYFKIVGGNKIAAIKATTAGALYVTEGS